MLTRDDVEIPGGRLADGTSFEDLFGVGQRGDPGIYELEIDRQGDSGINVLLNVCSHQRMQVAASFMQQMYGDDVDRLEKIKGAWSEHPPTRTRRFTTDQPEALFGQRDDLLRRTPEGWRLASRTVHLDQTVLTTRSSSFFI